MPNLANGWAGLVRFGGIGDNLIAVSPAAALKKRGFQVEMITSDPAWQVFEHNPNIDKLSVKSKREIPANDMKAWQDWHWGRSDEFEIFANLSHSIECLFAFVPESTPFYYPARVRRRLAHKSYLEHAHDLAQVPYEFGPLFYPSAEEDEKAEATKRKIGEVCIGWCLSGTRVDKLHPYSPGIIARLLKELDVPVVMIGGMGRNFVDAKAIMEHVEKTNGDVNHLHLALSKSEEDQNWPIRRSLTQALHCDLMIGPDTGIMWGVAMEAMPKIMMLGHASPENITKHWVNTITLHADPVRVECWPCHRLHNSPATCTPNSENTGAACMTDISVETIVATARRALERKRNSQLLLAAE
jgi:ADP-heptose:LPS heptosyltransferase